MEEELFRDTWSKVGANWHAYGAVKGRTPNQCADHYYSCFSKKVDEQKAGGWSAPNGEWVKLLRATEAPALELCRQKPMVVETAPDVLGRDVSDGFAVTHDPRRRASVVRLNELAQHRKA